MKKYRFKYTTHIDFNYPVTNHAFKLRAVPCDCAFQNLELLNFSLLPIGARTLHGYDGFGNKIQYGCLREAHREFAFLSEGILALETYAIPDENPKELYLQETVLTQSTSAMRTWAEAIGNEAELSPLERALALSNALHPYLSYISGITDLYTTAGEAFKMKCGVCQDYAHILLALCRLKGIKARYVCGFVKGEGATHAWVEVWSSGNWYGVDPTTNLQIDFGYIKLAQGRDANDCPVSRGTFQGQTSQIMNLKVIVEEII